MTEPLITVSELRSYCEAAFSELERFHGSSFKLPGDFYRCLGDDEMYRLDKDYSDFLVGSHSEESEFLKAAVGSSGDGPKGWAVMLNYIAALLLAVRHSILSKTA
ncbi:MAG: hypothetical protein JO163_22630 [Methylobacteriaceae bacterium]|nr:hypothetical protein [Methylobacteriaceae bacterium]